MKNLTLKQLTEKHNELASELNLKTIKEFKISKAQAIVKINDLESQLSETVDFVTLREHNHNDPWSSWKRSFDQLGTLKKQLSRMSERTVKILNLANGTRTAEEIATFVGMTTKSLKKRIRHLKRNNGFMIHVDHGRVKVVAM